MLLVSCGLSQDGSQKFRSVEGRFQIKFPSKPKITNSSFTREYGVLDVHSFLSEPADNTNSFYELSYVDYPKSIMDTISTDGIYDLFLKSPMGNISASKVNSMGTVNHRVLGYIGREYRWKDIESGNFFRIRLFMVENRMYQMIVDTNADNNFNIYIDQFFESFELINVKSNPVKDLQPMEYTVDIDFPYPTEQKEMETLTEYGNTKVFVEGTQHSPEDEQNLAYMVSVMKYPKDITKSENFNLHEHYSELIKNGLQNRQSELTSRKEILLDGIHGIETKEDFGNGQIIITQQSFLKGDTQIIVNVMAIPQNDDNLEMKKFFNSLKLKGLN